MRRAIRNHISSVLKHLYISPLEACNLHCAMCYTKKDGKVLGKEKIMDFINRYQRVHPIETITFCGGEVFVLPWFIELVNELTRDGRIRDERVRDEEMGTNSKIQDSRYQTPFFIQIITNGTIDRLDEFENPNSVNLIVSLDGLSAYHDSNRGKGSFTTSVKFLQKARQNGFHTEVFSILTRENFPQMQDFEQFLRKKIDPMIHITYHPRKPKGYLSVHPVSNIIGSTDGFGFLKEHELKKLFGSSHQHNYLCTKTSLARPRLARLKKFRNFDVDTFPPKNLGCYQISVMSDGRIYGCCEGIRPIGTINSSISRLIDVFKKRIDEWDPKDYPKDCMGCIEGKFMCGFDDILTSNKK